MLKRFIAAACLCAATVAEADPGRLSGQEITGLVAGATVQPRAQVESKLHIAAPAPLPAPANSLVAAPPAETLAGAERSSKSEEEKPVTEAPSIDAAQTPSTPVSSGDPKPRTQPLYAV